MAVTYKGVATVFKETTTNNQKVITATTTEQEGSAATVANFANSVITNNIATVGNGSITIIVTEKEETT